MSNSTKIALSLSAGEVGWETLGWWFLPKLWTPGKGVAKAVDWMFPDFKDKLNKKVNKPKKEVNKPITNIDELRAEISNFALSKKSDADGELNEKDKKVYKNIKSSLSVVGNKYEQSKDLFLDYHDSNDKKKSDGFKIVSSNKDFWKNNTGPKNDKCVFILEKDAVAGLEIKNWLNESSGQWKILCDAAAKLNQEIAIGFGLHESGDENHCKLRGHVCLGLRSDYEDDVRIANFVDEKYSILDSTLYDLNL